MVSKSTSRTLEVINGGQTDRTTTPIPSEEAFTRLALREALEGLIKQLSKSDHRQYNVSDSFFYAQTLYALRLREEAATMDWQEKYLDKLDRDIDEMKESLRATEERIGQMVNQTLAEMRDRDNQRHQEFLDIRNFLSEERRWIIGMAVTTILGVAAMVIAVLLKL